MAIDIEWKIKVLVFEILSNVFRGDGNWIDGEKAHTLGKIVKPDFEIISNDLNNTT